MKKIESLFEYLRELSLNEILSHILIFTILNSIIFLVFNIINLISLFILGG